MNIGRRDLFQDEDFIQNDEIDNEDKAFIMENFVDFQHS
jgi:hypothetical protein